MFSRNVAITFDSWTNCTNTNFLAVTGHFLSSVGKLKSTLLKLIRTSDTAHTGQNLADIFNNEVIKDIKNKIICAVTDNGANVVLAIKMLQIRHFSCFAHTVQLVITGAIVTSSKDLIFPITSTKKRNNDPQKDDIFQQDEIENLLR